MTPEEFELIAAKVLAGEASAEESARLERLIGQDQARRREFEDLQAAWASWRELGPAVCPGPGAAPIPEAQLRALLAGVRQKHRAAPAPARPWFAHAWRGLLAHRGLAAALGALALAGVFWRLAPSRPPDVSNGELAGYLVVELGAPRITRGRADLPAAGVTPLRLGDQVRLKDGERAFLLTPEGVSPLTGPAEFAARGPAASEQPESPSAAANVHLAFFAPLPALLADGGPPATRAAGSIAIYSPRSASASLDPTVLWKTEPGRSYDLVISDELNSATPPWRLTAAASPVRFAEVEAWRARPLRPDHLYRITVQASGRPFSAASFTFTTLPEAVTGEPPGGPAQRLAGAWQALRSRPACTGDALAALLALPPELAASEAALRLQLLAFGQLGLIEEYRATAARLATAL